MTILRDIHVDINFAKVINILYTVYINYSPIILSICVFILFDYIFELKINYF